MSLMRVIAGKREGITRVEIIDGDNGFDESGGSLTTMLTRLTESGFVHKYLPLSSRKRGEYYRVTDEFCAFYLQLVEGQFTRPTKNNWLQKQKSPTYRTWSGYAFETICLLHAHQIVQALNVQTAATISSWRYMSTSSSSGVHK